MNKRKLKAIKAIIKPKKARSISINDVVRVSIMNKTEALKSDPYSFANLICSNPKLHPFQKKMLDEIWKHHEENPTGRIVFMSGIQLGKSRMAQEIKKRLPRSERVAPKIDFIIDECAGIDWAKIDSDWTVVTRHTLKGDHGTV